ncbi:MAG TPA: MBL fold metallo-hydrolase, partial [Bacillota bacterium]|nr:MBL fold metallo-hydrolase [Bacillota bacterium]
MEQILPGVWLVKAENKGRFPFAHSLFLEGDPNLLIDTGAGSGLAPLSGRVELVLLSHYHRDHVMGNHLFADAAFKIHPLDAPGVQSLEGFLELSGLGRFCGADYWKLVRQSGFTATSLAGSIEDGMRFDLGTMTVQVLHTPGHTPGHCAFLIEEYETVFAADIDLTSFGPWYGNPTSDPASFLKSIQRLRSLKPALLLSSHSSPVRDGLDRCLAGYAAVIQQREEKLYQALTGGPKTLEQLIDLKLIYGRHPYPEHLFRFFEGNMIEKHLQLMLQKARICVRILPSKVQRA